MSHLNSKSISAFGVHVLSLFAFYCIISFIFTRNIFWIGFSGLFLTLITVTLIWVSASSTYSKKIKWLTETEDPLTMDIIDNIFEENGKKIQGVAVLNSDTPNAFVMSWSNLKPVLFFTRSLLYQLDYSEVRAVTKFLFGLTKSKSLVFLTYFSALLRMSLRFIDTSSSQEDMGMLKKITSIPGWFLFNMFWRMFSEVAEETITHAEDYVNDDEFNQYYLSALVNTFKNHYTGRNKGLRDIEYSLKGLMFLDPSAVVIDKGNLSRLLGNYDTNINLSEVNYPSLKRIDEFMVQRPVHVRVQIIIDNSKRPLKYGEMWIS